MKPAPEAQPTITAPSRHGTWVHAVFHVRQGGGRASEGGGSSAPRPPPCGRCGAGGVENGGGTTWAHARAAAQIITAVIGSGVLWLTFYFGSMGWIGARGPWGAGGEGGGVPPLSAPCEALPPKHAGGLIMLCLFAWITWYTSSLVRAGGGERGAVGDGGWGGGAGGGGGGGRREARAARGQPTGLVTHTPSATTHASHAARRCHGHQGHSLPHVHG